jgi:hypothetical protein
MAHAHTRWWETAKTRASILFAYAHTNTCSDTGSIRTYKHMFRYWDPLPIEANDSVVSLPSMVRKKNKAGVTCLLIGVHSCAHWEGYFARIMRMWNQEGDLRRWCCTESLTNVIASWLTATSVGLDSWHVIWTHILVLDHQLSQREEAERESERTRQTDRERLLTTPLPMYRWKMPAVVSICTYEFPESARNK